MYTLMRQVFYILILAFFPLFFSGQSIKKEQTNALAFTHITVLDMAGGPAQTDMTVIVSGNRITAVQKSRGIKLPKGTNVINSKGKFLLPGLWDMHAHSWDSRTTRHIIFPLQIANGITGVRDMFSNCYEPACTEGGPVRFDSVRTFREEIATGKLVGPRIIASSPIVDGPDYNWPGSIQVANAAQGREAVTYSKRIGVDFVKVYSGLPREGYFAIAEECKNQSISFAGHVPDAVTAEEVANAGQKSIEHLSEILLACSTQEEQIRQERKDTSAIKPRSPEWWAKWTSHHLLSLETYSQEKATALFALFVKNGTWQCPTLVVLRSGGYMEQLSKQFDDRQKYLPASIKQFWLGEMDFRKKNLTTATLEMWKSRYQKQLQIVGAMKQAGVPLLAGADALNSYVFPGFSLHDELELLVQAGLSPLEALQAATLNPAKFLGLTVSLGTVEKGKWADLLLLDANPLENIANTKKIAAVVANGRYFPKKTLEQMLKEAETAAGKQ